jgi:hypothetical protein
MASRRPRWVPILVVVALTAATIVAVPPVREPVLRAAGWALIVNEPVAAADIIVIVPDLVGGGCSKRRISSKAASRRELRFLPTLRVEKTTSLSAEGSLTKMRLQGRLTN